LSAALDLSGRPAVETIVEHLLPGDRIRRSGRTLRVERIAVTPGLPVKLNLRTLSSRAEELSLPMGTMVWLLP